jgi:hypothetical protein
LWYGSDPIAKSTAELHIISHMSASCCTTAL